MRILIKRALVLYAYYRVEIVMNNDHDDNTTSNATSNILITFNSPQFLIAHKGINGTFASAELLYTIRKDKVQEP